VILVIFKHSCFTW